MNIPKRVSYNQCVEDVFPGQGVSHHGEVGIEIEIEGTRLLESLPAYWTVHQENSLRGESKEYALLKPVKRGSAGAVLSYLKKRLDNNEAKIHDSTRTSVHVHLNCQGIPMRVVYNQICVYLILESIFMEYAGETRIGNVFCLRAKDAEEFVDVLVDAAKKDDFSRFDDADGLRYTSINICALSKFNSLEYRGLRGTMDLDVIKTWIGALLAIKDAAAKYKEPRDIISEFSGLGPREWAKKILGKYFDAFQSPKLEKELWENIRLIQEIAYAVDWEVPEKPIRKRVFKQVAPRVNELARALRPNPIRVNLNRHVFDPE